MINKLFINIFILIKESIMSCGCKSSVSRKPVIVQKAKVANQNNNNKSQIVKKPLIKRPLRRMY